MQQSVYWLFVLTFVFVAMFAATGKIWWFFLSGVHLLAMLYKVFEKHQVPKTDFWLLVLSVVFAMIFAAKGRIGWMILGAVPLLVMLYRANFQESKQETELEPE